MCHCTPEIRTPFCGKPGCEWPAGTEEETRSARGEREAKIAEWATRILREQMSRPEEIMATITAVRAHRPHEDWGTHGFHVKSGGRTYLFRVDEVEE